MLKINYLIPIIGIILSLTGIITQKRVLMMMFFFEGLLLSIIVGIGFLEGAYGSYMLIILVMAAVESAFGISLIIGLYKLGGGITVNSINNLWG